MADHTNIITSNAMPIPNVHFCGGVVKTMEKIDCSYFHKFSPNTVIHFSAGLMRCEDQNFSFVFTTPFSILCKN